MGSPARGQAPHIKAVAGIADTRVKIVASKNASSTLGRESLCKSENAWMKPYTSVIQAQPKALKLMDTREAGEYGISLSLSLNGPYE
jgi:hypothetical protein